MKESKEQHAFHNKPHNAFGNESHARKEHYKDATAPFHTDKIDRA